jgi:DNA-binding response OmpR family regulator
VGPIDGIELACHFREQFRIPTVFLSGLADPETKERALLAKPLGFLPKPYRASQVFNVIQRALSDACPWHISIAAAKLVKRHGRVKKEKAAITAEFLFRYMVARYRCVGGSVSSGRIGLASEIRGGLQIFEGAIRGFPGRTDPFHGFS